MGTATSSADAASARFRALARASEALCEAAGVGLVVLLEDLQWADTASLDLLRHVAGDATARGLLVLGTVREPTPEEAAGALANLGRYGATTLRLAPFTAEEVAACVGTPDTAEVLRRTGGLPLLVAALRDRSGGDDLASIVSGLIAPLSPAQRDLVRAAAVLGTEVDPELLAAVLPDADEVVSVLDAAWHAGVLAVDAAEHARAYRFAHDLVREEVARRTDPARARTLHRAAAEALARNHSPQAVRIAAHWRRAGTDAAARAAGAEWYRRAARQANERHAYADAARYLAQALESAGADDPGALVDLARAEYLAGRVEGSLRACERAAAVARAAGRSDLVAEAALVLQGVTYPQAANVVERLCREALDERPLPAAVRAKLLAQPAPMLAATAGLVAAAAGASAALDLARECADPAAEFAAVRAACQMTLRHAEDMAKRLDLGELAVRRARTLRDPLSEALGHVWRIESAYLLGRLDLVDEGYAGLTALADRTALPLVRWYLYRARASRALLEGRFAQAREDNRRATELARAGGDDTAIAMTFVHARTMGVLRGDPGEIDPQMWTALEFASRKPPVDSGQMQALYLSGRAEEAREAYTEVTAKLPIDHAIIGWPGVLQQLVDQVEEYGDARVAGIVSGQLAEFAEYPGALGTPPRTSSAT